MATNDDQSTNDTPENAAGDPPPTSRHTPTPPEPVNDTDESAIQLRTPGPAPDEQGDTTSTTTDEDTSDTDTHVCDVCGFEAESAGGLASHESTHDDSDE